jgi:cellobiose-specific phosphotransferase system component IIA
MKAKYLTTTAIAALLIGSSIAWQAAAADKSEASTVTVEAKGGPTDTDVAKMSKEGLLAMRSVFAARPAINDGDYEAAKKMLKTAQDALKQVAEADKLTTVKGEIKEGGKVVDTSKEKVRADLIPISGQFQIVEDFAPTPEKTEHMNKAHEHMKKGDTKSAIDELKLADIGVVFQRIEMPLVATRDHVDAAISLLNDGKYHDANMALKAAEDGLQYNAVSIVAPLKADQAPKS